MAENVERELKPVFVEQLFSFDDMVQVPDHYEEWPNVPNYLGMWAIFGWSGGPNTINYAVDVISEDQAMLLANAKRKYFAETHDMFGFSPDVYILDPDGNHKRYSFGEFKS